MKITSFLLMAFMFMALSCKNQTDSNTGSQNNATEVATEAPAEAATAGSTPGKYAIKSGIVVYKTQIMGMDAEQTLSFDDYGKLEATDVVMDVMGTKMHTLTITGGGNQYTIDMVAKTGTKIAVSTSVNGGIDFQNLTEQMEKDMNLKKLGKEDFLGKSCEKMSIDYTKMKMTGTFLVYKGVPLKMDTDMGSLKMNLVGISFDENAVIPAEKFVVPEGITITSY